MSFARYGVRRRDCNRIRKRLEEKRKLDGRQRARFRGTELIGLDLGFDICLGIRTLPIFNA